MNAIFKKLITAKIILVYMNDVIIPSVDVVSGLEALCTVLDVASQYGLLINWKKCRFLQSEIEYLGHVICNGSIHPSEHKTKAVMQFAKPQDVNHLQSF